MQHLSGFDGMWYAGDRSRTSKAIMGSLCIFEPSEENNAADVNKVVARLRDRLKVLPPLRRRVDGVAIGINNQYWRECVVNVSEHVQEQTLPSPGDDRQLARAVSDIMETGLDRSRPMWDLTIFHGVSGGRVAHLLRVHHAATDGGTMQRIFGLLSDDSDEFAPTPDDYPGPLLSDLQAKGEMVRKGVVRMALMPTQALQMQRHTLRWLSGRLQQEGATALPALVAQMLPGALGRPVAKVVNARRGPQDRKVAPIQPRVVVPDTRFNAKITHERSYAFSALPMADLLRVSKYFGVTFHSVVAALSASAARSFLIASGEPVDQPLILMSPYSLRMGGEESYWANYAANFQAELPVHLSDPVERLQVTGRNVADSRANYDTMPTDLMLDLSRMVPQLVFDTVYGAVDHLPEELLKRTSIGGNFTVSNIRGPRKRFQLWDQQMSGFYPVSFLGQGLAHNVTVMSYADELQMGFTACPTVFPHEQLWDWARYYRNGLQELVDIMDGRGQDATATAAPATSSAGVPATTRRAAAATRPAGRKAAAPKAPAVRGPKAATASTPASPTPAGKPKAVAGKRGGPRKAAATAKPPGARSGALKKAATTTPAADIPDQAAPQMAGNGVPDFTGAQNGSSEAAPAPTPSMAPEASTSDGDDG